MSAVDFFDANIILYGLDANAPAVKRRRSEQLVAEALSERSAVISWQIVQETLNVVTGRFKSGISEADCEHLLADVLIPLWQVQPSMAIFSRSLAVQRRYRFSYYDSLVVGAALEAGCKRLLTEDLQHGQKIEGLRIENPFRV